MTFVWGAVLAAGVLLTLSPWLWPLRERPAPEASHGRIARLLEGAGLARLSPGSVIVVAEYGLATGTSSGRTRCHGDGPSAAGMTVQRERSRYQDTASSSHPPWPSGTSRHTTGSLLSGCTRSECATS